MCFFAAMLHSLFVPQIVHSLCAEVMVGLW